MDITESLAPKSDQLDAVDLITGPRTFTIESITRHNADQPFNFHLVGFPRVWRPGKSMRRVIATAWGPETDAYIGQQVTLYCDPSVMFGSDVTGGTRISHMTGIDKPLKVSLLIKRGKSGIFTVQPLTTTAAPRDWVAEATAATTADETVAVYRAASKAGADAATVLDPIATMGTDRRAAEASIVTAAGVES